MNFRHCRVAKKKPTRQNTLRYSTASVYLLTSLPASAGLLFIQSSIAIEERASISCFLNATKHTASELE